MSMTEHEANNAHRVDQRQAVAEPQRRPEEVGAWPRRATSACRSRKRAFDLENAAATKLKKMGVKIVEDVDKASFQKIADPYLDKLAKDLGPHADKIKTLIRAIN